MLAVGVLSIAAFNLLGAYQLLRTRAYLQTILIYPPEFLAVLKLAWGVVGVVVAWSLWAARPWAPTLTRWVSVVFIAFIWLDRMALNSAPGRGDNGLFVAAISVLSVLLVFFVLHRVDVKRYFGETHEHPVER